MHFDAYYKNGKFLQSAAPDGTEHGRVHVMRNVRYDISARLTNCPGSRRVDMLYGKVTNIPLQTILGKTYLADNQEARGILSVAYFPEGYATTGLDLREHIYWGLSDGSLFYGRGIKISSDLGGDRISSTILGYENAKTLYMISPSMSLSAIDRNGLFINVLTTAIGGQPASVPPTIQNIFAEFMISHQDRLFLFNADIPFSTGLNAKVNMIASDSSRPGVGNNWNEIIFNNQAIELRPTGAVSTPGGLIVFNDTRSFVIVGTFGIDHQIRQLSLPGCVAPFSIASIDASTFFYLSSRGIIMATGSQYRNISSGGIIDDILDGITNHSLAMGVWWPEREQYWLAINHNDGIYSNSLLNTVLVYDMRRQSWYVDDRSIDYLGITVDSKTRRPIYVQGPSSYTRFDATSYPTNSIAASSAVQPAMLIEIDQSQSGEQLERYRQPYVLFIDDSTLVGIFIDGEDIQGGTTATRARLLYSVTFGSPANHVLICIPYDDSEFFEAGIPGEGILGITSGATALLIGDTIQGNTYAAENFRDKMWPGRISDSPDIDAGQLRGFRFFRPGAATNIEPGEQNSFIFIYWSDSTSVPSDWTINNYVHGVDSGKTLRITASDRYLEVADFPGSVSGMLIIGEQLQEWATSTGSPTGIEGTCTYIATHRDRIYVKSLSGLHPEPSYTLAAAADGDGEYDWQGEYAGLPLLLTTEPRTSFMIRGCGWDSTARNGAESRGVFFDISPSLDGRLRVYGPNTGTLIVIGHPLHRWGLELTMAAPGIPKFLSELKARVQAGHGLSSIWAYPSAYGPSLDGHATIIDSSDCIAMRLLGETDYTLMKGYDLSVLDTDVFDNERDTEYRMAARMSADVWKVEQLFFPHGGFGWRLSGLAGEIDPAPGRRRSR